MENPSIRSDETSNGLFGTTIWDPAGISGTGGMHRPVVALRLPPTIVRSPSGQDYQPST